MPCYLFTFHTYGSWLPDRSQGFVRRGEGILPPDKQLAGLYRNLMQQGTVTLAEEIQLVVIETLVDAAPFVECRPHAVATDDSHIHFLVSWQNEQRGWEQTRSSFKKSITMRLKRDYSQQRWLSRDASRKQVSDRSHFEYVVGSYLPKHRGWKWEERVGYFRTMEERGRGISDET